MARIDVRCSNDHVHEVDRPIRMWPDTPVCPECGAATTQTHLPPSTRWTLDPVIVYRAGDGTYRFPGDASGTQAKRYEAQGFDRIELRSAQDVRRFERTMNERELSRARRRVEIACANREQRESTSRSELRRHMQHFSRFGRDVARAAMDRNNGKARLAAKDPGFHVEAFSYDRSNREESRDPQGRRRRD